VDGGGVEQRDLAVGPTDERGDFRASEDDRLGAGACEGLDDAAVLVSRTRQHLPDAEFVVDDAMDRRTILRTGDDAVETVLPGEAVLVEAPSIVNPVPSSPTVPNPAALTAFAVGSAT
jgi:hypothetical protein